MPESHGHRPLLILPGFFVFLVLVLAGSARALDLGPLRLKVSQALDEGDQPGALRMIEQAKKQEGLNASEYALLTLLEADSREDGVKAESLMLEVAGDESLPATIRGQAEKALGARFYLSERCPEALPRLAKARELLGSDDPAAFEAAYFEGCCAAETGDLDRAHSAFSVSQKGDAALAIWSAVGLAEVDIRAGKLPEARARLHGIYESPDGAPYRGFLLAREADVARRQGKESEARILWNQVVDKFPDSVAALEAREKVREVPSVPGAAFTLRAGAFSSEARAKTQVEFLRKTGFEGRVVRKEDGSKAPFKVWVGSFKDRAAAEKDLKRVEQETGIRCQVVETAE